MRRISAVLLLASVFALPGCAPRPRVEQPPAVKVPEAQAPALAGARVYTIDPASSQVHVLVYRGGPMARLGHNHVMSARALTGRIWLHRDLTRSGFELSFPVAQLAVDDREARLAAGPEFPPDIPDKDKEGTRVNMLRTDVLDAATYPEVKLRSVEISGELPNIQVTAAITLKQVIREVVVPVQVATSERAMRAQGELTLKQTDFGIKPFSVAMGAVQVQDELRIRFDLAATTTPN
jgi:polyisoprenoid-binding protein YceI